MAIIYTHTETGDQAQKEPWRWVAVYEDSTTLEQFELKGGKAIFHRFAEIDQSRLLALRMIHNTLPAVTILPPEGAKVIHFYRNYVLRDGQIRVRHYFFGFENNGQKQLICINHDNEVIILNDPNQVKMD